MLPFYLNPHQPSRLQDAKYKAFESASKAKRMQVCEELHSYSHVYIYLILLCVMSLAQPQLPG
jgi:hypothetical protein